MGTSTTTRLYWRLAIALLALSGAYGWFVTIQYGRLNDLNQRQLANAAAELKRSIENAVETVTRFKPAASTEADGEAGSSPLCKFDDDQPYLELPPNACEQFEGPFEKVEAAATSPLSIEAVAAKSKATIAFEFQTDAVLHELSFPESFGLIFIAKDDGSVLYQEAPSKRSWLRYLRWGEQQFRDSGASQSGTLKLERLADVFGDDKASGWPRLRSMSGRASLRLAGQSHEIYFEPLVLENGKKVSLVLGGAVPTEALVRQALAVDSYFLATLVFLLLAVALGFPFVKLMSLDPRERFRLRDVMALYLSTAALLALVTFAIQGLDAYIRWHHVADEGLRKLSCQFEQAYLEEIAKIRRQVDSFDEQLATRHSADQLERQPLATNWYSREKPELPLPDKSLLVLQASWIRPDGTQVWKITTDPITARQRLSQRVYFQSVRDNYLFKISDRDPVASGGASAPFYAGPERSITDGKFYTFVAMPSRMKARAADRGRGGFVVAATARLSSLNTPALPAGYGFALVNREGRVLYHSDRRLSLRENLFEELSQGTRARAIVYAGREEDLTSAYRERPHEFHFRPISLRLAADDTPAGLYLATFRDISLERTLVGRVFLISLSAPMFVLLLFTGMSLASIAMVPVGRRQHWSTWLWPHEGLVHVYREISIVLSVLVLSSAIAWTVGAADALFAAMPILAMAAAVAIYALSTRRKPSRRRLISKSWHSAMVVLFLTCAIVVPASALFRAAISHEFGKLIATEQEWVAALHTDLPAAFEADLRQEKRPAELMARTPSSPLLDSPRPFDTAPSEMRMAPSTHLLLAPFHWADSLLPIENDYAARERYEERDYAYTPEGRWLPKLAVSGWGVLGMAGTLALLAWWIRWQNIRLFFTDREAAAPSTSAPAALWAECTKDEQLVLIRVARERVANPYQRPVVEGLLKRGLLTLDPELQPCTREFARFIAEREPELQTELQQWEAVESSHSWRYARLVLLTTVVGLGFFLIATQPGLQAGLVGVAGGITGALTALLKLRDAVMSWVSGNKTTA